MTAWRMIPLESEDDSYLKMATEEAVMGSVRRRDSPPTLRFYAWKRPAVALGYFQETSKELDLDECRRDGVEVFRRITGGGAVYKSPAYEVNYSLIAREDDEAIPKGIEESYRTICQAVMRGLAKLGYETTFKPINDILLEGKKVSGNAQTRVDNVILHHGTILLKPEPEKMFRYLKVDEQKLKDRKVEAARDLVTGLCEHGETTKEEVQAAVAAGFSEEFGKRLEEAPLTAGEKEAANELYRKYSDEEFIYWR